MVQGLGFRDVGLGFRVEGVRFTLGPTERILSLRGRDVNPERLRCVSELCG